MRLKAGETLDRKGFKQYLINVEKNAEGTAGKKSRTLNWLERYLIETGIELADVDTEAFADWLKGEGANSDQLNPRIKAAIQYLEYILFSSDPDTNKKPLEKPKTTGIKKEWEENIRQAQPKADPDPEKKPAKNIETEKPDPDPTSAKPELRRVTFYADVEKWQKIQNLSFWRHIPIQELVDLALDDFVKKVQKKAATDPDGNYFEPRPAKKSLF